jgi:nucleoprotein TPR
MEGQLREANSARAAFESAKARMEQEAALMQQHNDWLRAELTKKSEELLGARKVRLARCREYPAVTLLQSATCRWMYYNAKTLEE